MRQTLSLLMCLIGLFFALPGGVSADGPTCALGTPGFSRTDPAIDRGHIFCGAVNGRDRGTGFHHRPGGITPESARIGPITGRDLDSGVYTAEGIAVLEDGDWHPKRGFSSFFPDSCTAPAVLASIAYAAANNVCTYQNGKWRGLSAPEAGEGASDYCRGDDGTVLTIEGYWVRGHQPARVATAWPLIDPQPRAACRR
jgi:hypothetical protein